MYRWVRENIYGPCGLSFQYCGLTEIATAVLAGRYRVFHRVAFHKHDSGYFVQRFVKLRASSDSNDYRWGRPLRSDDDFDFFVVGLNDEGKGRGLFFFPKEVAIARKFLGVEAGHVEGGSQVYPPWCKPKQHKYQRTQEWQLEYFVSNADEFRVLAKKIGIVLDDSDSVSSCDE